MLARMSVIYLVALVTTVVIGQLRRILATLRLIILTFLVLLIASIRPLMLVGTMASLSAVSPGKTLQWL